ncbi:BA75_01296T0 [Komagataella pastoris]|uniref:Octanoyltransferase n=1 Tax=Komagataella pastoris TaxID=4922 RepID=A0A1B2J7C9_PICPA|nr:BA75_01296T0 [Komagataella pastoris]
MSCSKFPPKFPLKLHHYIFRGTRPYLEGNLIQEFFVNRQLEQKKINNSLKTSQKDKIDFTQLSHIDPVALSFQFEPTYTGGKREKFAQRSSKYRDLQTEGIQFCQTSRGGQITYHGPGQLVVYPIINLLDFQKLTSKCYVSMLERSVILAIGNSHLKGETTENTGVWCNGQKISSIGVNIRRSITSHGLSINNTTDLSYVNDEQLVMCGLPGTRQTSISTELQKLNMSEVVPSIDHLAADIVGQLAENLEIDSIITHIIESPITSEEECLSLLN